MKPEEKALLNRKSVSITEFSDNPAMALHKLWEEMYFAGVDADELWYAANLLKYHAEPVIAAELTGRQDALKEIARQDRSPA